MTFDQRGQTVAKQTNVVASSIEQVGDRYYQGLTVAEVAALMAELKRVNQPAVWDGRIPYVGLRAFQESDAAYFFGREKLVQDLLARVQRSRFIVIAGPSGSGKSSVARAGLFHALRTGRLERSEHWLLATLRPGGDPLENLALALERATKSTQIGHVIRSEGAKNPAVLPQQLKLYLSDDDRQRCVLLVDQFEETFTQTREAMTFINLLTATAQAAEGRTIIVLAVRADFVSHFATYPELRAQISRQFLMVGAMAPAELVEAITRPALEVGAQIDAALVSRIMDDMKGEPGALPLMSFALRDLFDAAKTAPGKPLALTLARYLQRGGLEQALERHADQAFAALSPEQQALARHLFTRLIEIGQGRADTRRTATYVELAPAGVEPQAVREVVAALAGEGARLLTTSTAASTNGQASPNETDEATVTIAHEKLIDAWPWLRRLVDENREVIALQNQVAHDARAWAESEDDGFLYRGGRLLQVEEQLAQLQPALDAQSRQFIQASAARKKTEQQVEAERMRQIEALRQERENSIRFRRLTRWLSVAATVAVIATAVALLLLNTARQQSMAADESRATAEAGATVESEARSTAEAAKGEAETAAIAEGQARETAVAAQSTAVADANRATIAEATAVAAQDQTEHQRQITSLVAQSQALLNVRALDNQSFAQARLMAIAAMQTDQEISGGQNSALLVPWLYYLVRNLTTTYQPLNTLREHTNEVNSVAWHPNGSRLVSASEDGSIIIWDTASWQSLTRRRTNRNGIRPMVWRPDGNQLAFPSSAAIIIWDTANWQPLTTLREHFSPVISVAWHPNGSRLASASDDAIIIWDTANWQPLTTLREHTGSALAWHPNGSHLTSTSEDGSIIIWDTASWQPLTTLHEHTDRVWSIAWHPNGSHLASASGDGSIIIWDTANWQPLATLREHTDWVRDMAWHPDGSRLASASEDQSIIIWDTAGWQPLATLREHTGPVRDVAWHPDGSRLASASNDRRVIIWDTANWQPLTTVHEHTDTVWSMAWHPDGSRLASASDDAIIIWDTASWQPLTTLHEHTGRVRSMAWHPDGSRLASASDDRGVIIWDTANWQPLTTLHEHTGRVRSIAWHSDGSRLASASEDAIIIWDTTSWQPLTTLHERNTGLVAWHPDGSRLASEAAGGIIIIWDTANWQPLTTLREHMEGVGEWVGVRSMAWHPDGSRLTSILTDDSIIIWDMSNWQSLTTLHEHTVETRNIAWHPDGSLLASASDDAIIIIWDMSKWQSLTTLREHVDSIWSIAWHPDGSHLASASRDGTIIITNYDLIGRNCTAAGRNFTQEEWRDIFPGEPYRVVCPQWPAPDE